MGRSPCCDKSKVKRGTWSSEEDEILRNYLHNHGTGGNWITLPHKAGLKRCGKSCRLRWLNYLRPDIKHGGFTQDEEYIICNLYSKIGSRWSVIASHLAGRTDNEVKNYWNTKLKKKFMATKNEKASSDMGATTTGTSDYASYRHELENVATHEPLHFGSPRLLIQGSSDGYGNGNGTNPHFCPPYFQQDSNIFWSFEAKLLDEIVSEIWGEDEVVGGDVDAGIFHVDSTLHGARS